MFAEAGIQRIGEYALNARLHGHGGQNCSVVGAVRTNLPCSRYCKLFSDHLKNLKEGVSPHFQIKWIRLGPVYNGIFGRYL